MTTTIPQSTEFIEQCRRNWKEHVNRVNFDRYKKILTSAKRKRKALTSLL
jgi:hypothetical protein